jgi:branched-chain amino acid transport system ATP-binding protein
LILVAEPLLEVVDLAAGYGRIEALHGVGVSVGAAEAVCLIGRNGAGKTTLIKSIAGLIRPRRGRILLRGRDITSWPVQRRARAGIACVPEGRHVFAPLSVHDNLLLGGYRRGRREVRASLDEVYGRFPRLLDRRTQAAGTLSGGEQQMLAIGRALMSAPAVILLDEPSLGLAPRAVAEMTEILTALAGADTGILLVEQHAEVAFTVAGRGYLLERGDVRASGPSGELRNDARVRTAYLGAEPGSRSEGES